MDENNVPNGKVDDTHISLLDVSKYKIVPATTSDKKKKKEVQGTPSKLGLLGLFKYGTKSDICLMLLGVMFSFFQGITMPILGLVFGQMTNVLMRASIQGITNSTNNEILANYTEDVYLESDNITSARNITESQITAEEFNDKMNMFALYYLIIGCIAFCSSFLQAFLWEFSCERQIYKLRKLFFSQILRQEISWYELKQEGDLSSKLSDDIERIREGIGHKFSMVTQYLSTFVSGIAVGFYANWRLTSVLLGLAPLLIGTSAVMAKMSASSASREQLKYSLASGIADEVFNCLRTVAAFGGEKKETKRYEIAVEEGRKLVMKRYYILAVIIFFIFFIIYASYALAFWYGASLIGEGVSTPGSVFAVFFSVMTAAFSIGNILPYINAVSTAMGSASNIYGIIERKPKIDSYSKDGLCPKTLEGNIEFINVHFKYPSREDVEVLKGLNIEIKPGETVAIIGPSGAGKSTIVNLLLRFYDTTEGQVCIDGNDVKDLNLKWLRDQVGVVSQEPVLFGVSIAENVRYGKEDITMEDIEKACKLANAHSFIKDLPEGYNTQVGSRGAQLSGGQKQRIAIARALVRNPKILLLDEATSALDSQSEGVVQEALDKAMVGRTTIIIAHRLSTIRNADKIFALQDGVPVESGNHDELMAKKGLYYTLVMAQTREAKEKELFDDNENEEELQRQISNERYASTASLKSKGLSDDVENVEEEDINYLFRLTKMNASEWHYLALGIFACACVGSISPIFAYFYGEFFTTFKKRGPELYEAIHFWSLMFVALGVISGSAYWLQTVMMTNAAERLVARLRALSFKNILRQEISWFDKEEYSVGRLITRLARDAPIVKAASGMRAGSLTSSIVTLCSGVIIAVLFGWKLASLLIIGVPVLIYSGYKHLSLIRNNQIRDATLMDNAGKVASECLQNIRTVQSLGKEYVFIEKYIKFLELPFKESKKQAAIFAVTLAISQAVLFFLYSAGFRFGSYLITLGEMTPSEVYRVFFALSFCATAVGTSTAYLQDWGKARMAAKLIFDILDKKSQMDPVSSEGLKPEINGRVSFENIIFSYPSRKHVRILRGLTVSIEAGQTLALVGGSGCGKSTVISLLERFYVPDHGKIYIDDHNISSMNVAHLRAQLGLVTQEPDLFNCSIRDNIAYGALHKEISDQDIIQAAKTANIHNFIITLPQGYDTLCGDRGGQLSGGQKQRIAIARAIVRNPKILLLDEATSALDTESEKIVQEALDKAREGRTCIVIAHRLSTIQNADKIAVINKGRVVEVGTHEELKAKEGFYYELTKRQQL